MEGLDMAVKTDISQMTDAEIQEYLKQRKVQQANLVREKGVQAKAELETYCMKKYGMSLAAIFTASANGVGPKTYKNPESGSLYTYSGRGKVPGWLQGPDKKPNPAYEVRSN
jgi:DNA-binding protein H-NS